MASFIPKRFHVFKHNPFTQRLQLLHRTNAFIRNSSYSKNHVFRHSSIFLYAQLQSSTRCRCFSSVEQNKPWSHELSFQNMLKFRQMQARATILAELTSQDDAPYASKFCKDVGEVVKIISYVAGFGNHMLLVEFKEEEMAHRFLQHCYFKNPSESYPVYSRFVRYDRRKNTKRAVITADDIEVLTRAKWETRIYPCMVSHLMKKMYEEEKITDLSIRLRFLFAATVQDALSGIFPFCEAYPFGSSVNGFGTSNSDMDLVLQMFPEKAAMKSDFCFENKSCVDPRLIQQRAINSIYEILRTFLPGINYVQKIIHARVPILKFKHKIVDLDCDLSVNNMAAVYMAEILHFCGSLDPRVRPLVYAVKKWAKETNITYETPGSWITNFSLAMLVIFFLQNRPAPILPALLKAIDIKVDPDTYVCVGIEYIENPEKWRTMAFNNKETLGGLLREFFVFLSTYPFPSSHISVLSGVSLRRSNDYPIWVQYPLEEELNVTKNISIMELDQLIKMAKSSAVQLDKSLRSSDATLVDFEQALGIANLKRTSDLETIDVANLYEHSDRRKNKEEARRGA